MKSCFNIACIALLLCGATTISAATAEWKLKDAMVGGSKSFQILCVDATVTVRCDAEPELSITGPEQGILTHIEVCDAQGKNLKEVQTIRATYDLINKIVLKKGESQTFCACSCPFFIAQSGHYTASGYLTVQFGDGKTKDIALGKISFHVDAINSMSGQQKEPGQTDRKETPEQELARLNREMNAAMSQYEMNIASGELAQYWERMLQNEEAKILAECRDTKAAIIFIRTQKAWREFRDAEMEFQADESRGGSIQPLIRNSTCAALTENRVKELKVYLEGPEAKPDGG